MISLAKLFSEADFNILFEQSSEANIDWTSSTGNIIVKEDGYVSVIFTKSIFGILSIRLTGVAFRKLVTEVQTRYELEGEINE